jgi:hypothetical protein
VRGLVKLFARDVNMQIGERLPYAVKALDGRDRFILVGRDYKPLGMAQAEMDVDYESPVGKVAGRSRPFAEPP